MVENNTERKVGEEKLDFYINASEITDITLTEEESEKLIDLLNKGPNEKAKKFSIEAIKFYEEMVKKTEKFNKHK
jgi:hypothetical protein